MKQCPRCNRNYSDETISFCLEDGERLVKKYDPDATMINPYPPQPVVPPTVAYERTPPATPVNPAYFASAGTDPTPPTRSSLVVGVLVVIALAVGLTIGGVIFQRSSSTAAVSPAETPAQEPLSSHPTSPNAAPTVTPQVAAVVDSPPPISNTESQTAVREQGCVLYNDKSDKSVIRVRMNCDTQNCDNDVSTIAGEYPDNTPIKVVKGVSVQGSRFTWMKIILTSSGQTVWVASSKIKCV
jgi:hypothetical protein